MNLGENIHGYRVAKNMSQTDLANELEVSRQSVSKWENNSAQPELDKLCRMSELFDVTLDELVYGRKEASGGPGNPPSMHVLFPTRKVIGTSFMLFGMIFLLLSMFWGDKLRIGEALGEFLSICSFLLGLSLIATHNTSVLAVSGVVYFLYGIVCFGVFNVTALSNYLFMYLSGLVLLVWFINWGYKHGETRKAI